MKIRGIHYYRVPLLLLKILMVFFPLLVWDWFLLISVGGRKFIILSFRY